MTTLEKVMQLRQQGGTEPQIIEYLRQEGISPREIEEALSQSKIKSAINMEQQYQKQPDSIPQPDSPRETMRPSMSPMEYQQSRNLQQTQIQEPIEYEQNQVYGQPQEQYAPQYYEEYAPPQVSDVETMSDIAEQIYEEKTSEIRKQISEFTKFKDSLLLEVERINERLVRIENVFNELQVAILKKIGEYGEGVQNIEKEIKTTQNSFSKLVNPLTDNIRELQKITGLKTESISPQKTKVNPESTPTKKDKIGFEDYLR